MNIDTDQEFPLSWAQEVADILNEKSPGQATVKVINSPWGHVGCVKETDQMSSHIKEFMERLQ